MRGLPSRSAFRPQHHRRLISGFSSEQPRTVAVGAHVFRANLRGHHLFVGALVGISESVRVVTVELLLLGKKRRPTGIDLERHNPVGIWPTEARRRWRLRRQDRPESPRTPTASETGPGSDFVGAKGSPA